MDLAVRVTMFDTPVKVNALRRRLKESPVDLLRNTGIFIDPADPKGNLKRGCLGIVTNNCNVS